MNKQRLQQVRWLRFLFALVMLLSPFSALAAEPAAIASQEEYKTILLGEYVLSDVAAGETVGYAVYIPESGAYLVSTNDEEAAALFDLVVYDEAGEIIYEGGLLDAELDLTAGGIALDITATEDATLNFFLLGMIGTMSDSDREPGKLYPGSLYIEESVSEQRYATVTIPDVGYPQQVLLYVGGGEEDAFTVTAEGEDISYEYIYSNETDLLTFWTEGGTYLLTAEPFERRSELSLIVFLSGQPPVLAFDEPLDGTLLAGSDRSVYLLHLDTFYDDVTVEVESSSEEAALQVDVRNRLYSADQQYYATDDDGVLVVEMEALMPGTLLVVVERYDSSTDVDFTVTVTGEEGEPLGVLPNGEPFEGEIVSGETTYYEFAVSEAGTLVTVDLASDVEDADFDLAVGLSLTDLLWSSATSGANEFVQFMAPTAGTYYVQVQSYSGEGAYTLTAEEGDFAPELFSGEVTEGSIDENGRMIYRLAVDEPGQILSVLLVGGDESDLDLAVSMFSESGESLLSLSSVNAGSAEIVSQAAAIPGTYEIIVRAYGPGDDYRILVRLEDPADLLEMSDKEAAADAAASGGFGSQVDTQPDATSADGLLFADDFEGDGGYLMVGSALDGSLFYADGVYRIEVNEANHFLYGASATLKESHIAPQESSGIDEFQNVRVAVDMTFTEDVERAFAGVICGMQDDAEFYVFMISADGRHYTISHTSQPIYLAGQSQGEPNPVINTGSGATNAIEGVCADTGLQLIVNGEILAEYPLEASPVGQVAVVGWAGDATPIAVEFDNLVVNSLAEMPEISAIEGENVVFTDDFSSPSTGWFNSTIDETVAEYSDSGYMITLQPDSSHYFYAPTMGLYTDTSTAAEIIQNTGSEKGWAGLLCRLSGGNYYDFVISAAGDYSIGKYVDETFESLVDWTAHEAIIPGMGASNLIQIDCIGDTLSLYINGELVDELQDSDLAVGQSGLETGSSQASTEPTEFVFNNFSITLP